MAKIVQHYNATVQGSGNIYIYQRPDNTSTPQRVYAGNTVSLRANYASTGQNGYYQLVNGWWIAYWNVTNITPVYQIVTDACTPPASVTLDAQSKTLTVSGGAGGDMNNFVGYGVSWRDRPASGGEWGAWTEDTVITGQTLAVEALPGEERAFRARTRGSAGEAYFSDYVQCDATLLGNTQPPAPQILLPQAGAVSGSATPVAVVRVAAEPDGDAQVLQRQVDGGAWTDAAQVGASGGTVYDRLPSLAVGSHTLAYRLWDGFAYGPQASVSLTVQPFAWSRAIEPGTVIANATVSHRADLHELAAAVNRQRAFYGLEAVALPGTVGAFADWKAQIQALQAGVAAAQTAAGQNPGAWDALTGYPTAAAVNSIRQRVAAL